jgi:hypothetical protein
MSLIGWSKTFEDYKPVDVLEGVRKTEKTFWCSLLSGIALLVAGGIMMTSSFQHGVAGLFLAIAGVVNIALVKIWAHIRLATYQTILELRMKNKEAQEG